MARLAGKVAIVTGAASGIGAGTAAVCGDVADAATIERVVATTIATFGQIDVIFNNAGIMPTGDLHDFAEATWDDVMAVNVKSMYLMCKAVIAHMLTRGAGSIIN